MSAWLKKWLLTLRLLCIRLLLIDIVASTATGHSALLAMERKGKKTLPIPVRLDDPINSNGQIPNIHLVLLLEIPPDKGDHLILAQLWIWILICLPFPAVFHVYRQSKTFFSIIWIKFLSSPIWKLVACITIHYHSTRYAWYNVSDPLELELIMGFSYFNNRHYMRKTECALSIWRI